MSRIGRAVLGSLLALACVVVPGQAVSAAVAAAPCEVDYDSYPNAVGLTANITIKNTGADWVRGWTLSFPLNEGLEIVKIWNAVLLVSKGQVQTQNVSWNGDVPPQGTAGIGFEAVGTVGPEPTVFKVNEIPCVTVEFPQPAPVEPPDA